MEESWVLISTSAAFKENYIIYTNKIFHNIIVGSTVLRMKLKVAVSKRLGKNGWAKDREEEELELEK